MTIPQETLKQALSLVGVITFALMAWWFVSWVINLFFGLDKTIVSAMVAGLVAIFGFFFTYWEERRKVTEEAHRDKKIAVYYPFLEMIFTVMKKINNNVTPDQSNNPLGQYLSSPEFFEMLYELKKGMTFYGSPEVIRAMNAWQIKSATGTDGIGQMRLIGDLLLAMRMDIGLSNSGLNSLSIFRMNVTEDIESLKGTT